jgi:hypothetical protein
MSSALLSRTACINKSPASTKDSLLASIMRSAEKIDVVVHPQSIIHSSIYYEDGSTLSQLGNPDMRSVISYAMSNEILLFKKFSTATSLAALSVPIALPPCLSASNACLKQVNLSKSGA